MPDHPIVDTHVHFWDRSEVAVDWLADQPALDRRFDPEVLSEHAGEVEIESLVFVEADAAPGQHVAEAEWVSRLARDDPRIQAIVAHAPLERGAAAEADLERLAKLPLVRGIRRLLQGEPDDAFCLRPDFVAGVELLPRYGFHFEICIYHRQFANALELARRCPQVPMILDHIGKPGIRDGSTQPWMDHMRALAELDHVTCKLSGVATEADHRAWTEEQLRVYVDHALECFGDRRIVFGGDWPVATLAIAYPRWVEIVDGAIADLDAEAQRRIWRDNARAFYRL